MILGNFTKQPVDVLDYDIDYSDWLTTGDNVESVTVVAEPTGLTVDNKFVNDPRVKIYLSGGSDGATYKITVTTTTADGRVKQDEFKLKVKEI
jgi:hypothetical protein